MVEAPYIITMIDVTILLLALILMIIYLLPIILIRRFHTANNILTANCCVTGIICCTFWVMYDLLSVFNPALFVQSTVMCTLIVYLPDMVNCLLIYSFVTITINRFFTITYPNKRLFKRQVWCFISLAVQWTVTIVVNMPILVVYFRVSVSIIHES
jgi:hypothetical protein